MVKFQDVIARADVDFYEEILGQSQIKLLNLMSGDYIKIRKLRELMYELYSPEVLLLNKNHRKLFLEYLREDEATDLCELLKLRIVDDNVYSTIINFKLRRNSSKESLFYKFFLLNVPHEEPEELKLDIENIKPIYSLFDHQNKACKDVVDILSSPLPKCILHMPTGSGKTRTAMNIICDHFRKSGGVVVWLAYSKELCEQALDEFTKAWGSLGNRDLEAYKVWGKYETELNDIDNGFVVAGFDKLYSIFKKDHNKVLSLGSKSTLVVIDEAHQSIARTYETVINLLTMNINTKMLGLTATPGRTSDDISEDLKLSNFFSRRKVTLEIENYSNPVEYLVDEGYLAEANFRSLYYEGGIELSQKDIDSISNNLDVPQDILNRIAINEQRNLKIIFEVERLIRDGHKRIILFGTTVQHAKDISSILSIRGILSKCITGETELLRREKTISEFKEYNETPFVLTNYGVLTTGFDAPKTSAAIIARPTKSLVLYSQMVGRAIRGTKAGGNKTAEIITTVDINLPGFNSVEEAFTNWEDVYNL